MIKKFRVFFVPIFVFAIFFSFYFFFLFSIQGYNSRNIHTCAQGGNYTKKNLTKSIGGVGGDGGMVVSYFVVILYNRIHEIMKSTRYIIVTLYSWQ